MPRRAARRRLNVGSSACRLRKYRLHFVDRSCGRALRSVVRARTRGRKLDRPPRQLNSSCCDSDVGFARPPDALRSPSPRVRGEGRDEGALPRVRACGNAPSPGRILVFARRVLPSPRKRGEGCRTARQVSETAHLSGRMCHFRRVRKRPRLHAPDPASGRSWTGGRIGEKTFP